MVLALPRRSGSTRRYRKLRAYVIRRDGCCQRCGGQDQLECHHVIPVAAGGLDLPSNLRTICKQCHDQLHGH